jgi:hypothetical protein
VVSSTGACYDFEETVTSLAKAECVYYNKIFTVATDYSGVTPCVYYNKIFTVVTDYSGVTPCVYYNKFFTVVTDYSGERHKL